MEKNRYDRGYQRLGEVTSAADQVIQTMRELHPDLAQYLVEFAYGDIYGRPGVDLKVRELAAVAALTAIGTAAPQLKVHIQGAVEAGCKYQEIVEVILQTLIYAGFPAATNGLRIASEVFKDLAGSKVGPVS